MGYLTQQVVLNIRTVAAAHVNVIRSKNDGEWCRCLRNILLRRVYSVNGSHSGYGVLFVLAMSQT